MKVKPLQAEPNLGVCPWEGCGAKGAQSCRVTEGRYKGDVMRVLVHPGREA